METMKTSNFTCQAKSFSSIFFTYQVCELHPFSCHVLAKYDIYSRTAESVLSHLNLSHQKILNKFTSPPPPKKKDPEMENFKSKKILQPSPSLEIWSTPLGASPLLSLFPHILWDISGECPWVARND